MGGEGDDSNDEIVYHGRRERLRVQGEVSETVTAIQVTCPLSIQKIGIPARGASCAHAQCFDLKAFLQFSRRDRDYTCTICRKGAQFGRLVIDLNMERMMREHPGETRFIVMDDGRYAVEDEDPKHGTKDVLAGFNRRRERRERMREIAERERKEREKERAKQKRERERKKGKEPSRG